MKAHKNLRIFSISFILVLVVVLSCTLVACGDNSDDKTQDGTDEVEQSISLEYEPNYKKVGSYNVKDGTCSLVGYSGYAEHVTIPSHYNNQKVTKIAQDAFKGLDGLKSVIIPESIIEIGSSAFEDCGKLTKISGPADMVAIVAKQAQPASFVIDITSRTTIDKYAFSGCEGLTGVTIPDCVQSIDRLAFIGCVSLESITVSDNNPTYSSIDGLLYNKAKTTLVLAPEGIGDTITIPDYVKEIGNYAFSNCKKLTNIVIPDGVENIGLYAFYECINLTSIDIPDSVTTIGSIAFYNTAWYNSQPDGIVYAGKVAYDYKGTMPANASISIKEGTLGISNGAFRDCSELVSVTIPASIINIGLFPFAGCANLSNITVEKNNVKYYSVGNCIIETDSKKLVLGCKNSVIPQDGSVAIIGDYAFAKCMGLTSITIPDGVTSIETYAFDSCEDLESVTIPSSVKNIGKEAFSYCIQLVTISYDGTKSQWGCIDKYYGVHDWNYMISSSCVIICTDGTIDIAA